jgi:hypothetical protein
MALVIADRVLETTTTTGTGAVTLAGAQTGYQSFGTAIGNGNTTYYTIVVDGGTDWEVGIGTYTSSGTSLSRDTVLASSNSGNLVNFGAGTKNVFVTYPAGEAVYYQPAGGVVITDNSSGNALRITQTGSGNALLVEDSANPDATPFVVDASGNVGVGITPAVALDVLGVIEAQAAATQDAIRLQGRAGGTSSYSVTLTPTTLTASRTLTLPDATTTVVGTDASQELTNKTLTNPTVTNYVETRFTANSSTAITLNLANGTMQDITLTASTTITMPTAVAGKSFILLLRTGSGSYTVTWSTVKWPGGTAPTVTTTASRLDIYSFFSDGTNWYGITVSQNYTP